jgi:hypothetical protein
MALVKRIVCLANSRKLSGRCIAGIELSGQQRIGWIRPVSAREQQEVSERECQYEDGNGPQVLDIIDINFLEAQPKDYQQENWLLDHYEYWVKVGRLALDDLPRLVDPIAPLWINGRGTHNGLNDMVRLSLTGDLNSSLRLIWAKNLTLSVFKTEGRGRSRRRVQGRFWYDGIQYWLWVTDPVYERQYLAKQDGDYDIGEKFLTISLTEPYNGSCYKLIAAIIEPGKGVEE